MNRNEQAAQVLTCVKAETCKGLSLPRLSRVEGTSTTRGPRRTGRTRTGANPDTASTVRRSTAAYQGGGRNSQSGSALIIHYRTLRLAAPHAHSILVVPRTEDGGQYSVPESAGLFSACDQSPPRILSSHIPPSPPHHHHCDTRDHDRHSLSLRMLLLRLTSLPIIPSIALFTASKSPLDM